LAVGRISHPEDIRRPTTELVPASPAALLSIVALTLLRGVDGYLFAHFLRHEPQGRFVGAIQYSRFKIQGGAAIPADHAAAREPRAPLNIEY
jgi:hypothetical protein